METEISVERALELIAASSGVVGSELAAAAEAHGRILAENIAAPMDQPPWPRSPLDGYALRAADSLGAARERPRPLRVVDTVYAGGCSGKTVNAGEAVRIMTGAPLPAGADCVIRQEDTDRGEEVVRIFKELKPWQNYCFRGEDFHRGDTLLPAGTKLDANAMGILASAGLCRRQERLCVYRIPRCALICTGDELADPGEQTLPAGKIYSSNAAILAGRLRELGMEPAVLYAGFPDDAAALAELLRETCESCDLVFTTGGVSVGAKDILHEALPLLGAERVFWRVELKPGSPLMLSVFRGVPILSLSGNPFAAAATFELFGRALLARRAGSETLLPHKTRGVLDTDFRKAGVRRFVRAVFRDGRVTLPEGHSSGQLRSAAGTNCLAELPESGLPLPAGSEVTVWLL